ncbi:helix-turn-helix domain-containing protein [Streptomyces sp. NBC_01317]|uniref:helix-turn-helix domain-containing protein n=1 Tax=Streptomyces sp. NBC_01317 TaxID=2903822 RepID=UPI002E0EBCE7|nr:helix-turn-helix domain-containing protein [Streptomyces sp. NBC_01317]
MKVLRTERSGVDRRSGWGDLVATVCGPLQVRGAGRDGFEGAIVTGAFGAVQLAAVRSGPHAVEKTELHAARAHSSPLYLTCILDGEVQVSQGGTTALVRAGSLFSYDSSSPFTLRMRQPIHMVAVKFDHRLVDLRPGQAHPLWAATWSGREGVGVLLADLLRSVACHMTELDTSVADHLGSSVASLVSAVCAEKLGHSGSDAAAARQALLHRIRTYARGRLGDPDLTPPELARAHNISLRYLQILFRDEGTSPALWIRNERLERCRDDLRNPRTTHLTVANIAGRWGLHGASHFSRIFRDRYGATPREWRKKTLLLPP